MRKANTMFAFRFRNNNARLIGVTLVLAVAALLRIWNLNVSGLGTQYYAAAVLSMLNSWHNFFFNSFDPGGFVSVDKPPLALWLQVASAKVLGFSGFSIRLPQVIEGVMLIALLYMLVQRYFGHMAGLLAALFLAIMPVSVAVDRSNNTDSCLVLCLVAAAWALARATEEGRFALLSLAMGLIGIAFNAKMLAAFVVIPPFVVTYLAGAPLPISARVKHLLLSVPILVTVSLIWCVIYDLTPPNLRPYAGSTSSNSMLELIVGENGVRRFVRTPFARPMARNVQARTSPPMTSPASLGGVQRSAAKPGRALASGQGGGGRGLIPGRRFGGADNIAIGPFRLFSPTLADQTGWFYPLVLGAIIIGLQRSNWPVRPKGQALWMLVGWALTYGVVLSYAGGIFHPYYLSAMAPPLCALAAICITTLWDLYVQRKSGAWLLAPALILVLGWQIYVDYGYFARLSSNPISNLTPVANGVMHLQYILAATSLLAIILVGIGLWLAKRPVRIPGGGLSRAAFCLGVAAISIVPTSWALGSIRSQSGANPSATPLSIAPLLRMAPSPALRADFGADPKLLHFLLVHSHGERFLVATIGAQQAAPIILATRKPVMAIGGFSGTDPILTPDRLSKLITQGQVRFVLIGAQRGTGFGGRGFFGRDGRAQEPLMDWIRHHGTSVEPALWRSPPNAQPNVLRLFRHGRFGIGAGRYGFGGRGQRAFNGMAMQLYDLKPAADTKSLAKLPG